MRLFSMRIGIFVTSEAERPSIWKTLINDKGVQREALAVLADAMGEDLGG